MMNKKLYKPLKEIGKIIRGSGLQKKDFMDVGIGCIHYGQIYTKYGLYANSTISFVSPELANKLKHVDPGDLVIAITSENVEDLCKCVAWLGNDYIVTGGHSAIFKHNENPKYLAYYFETPYFFKQKRKLSHGTKVIEISSKQLGEIKIPIPDKEKQNEIVEVLDSFQDLISTLKAELELREKQLKYYSKKIFEEVNKSTNNFLPISKIVKVVKGKQLNREKLKEVDKFPVFNGGISPSGYWNEFNTNKNKIIVSQGGNSAGYINYVKEPFWAGAHCYILENPISEINYNYLYFYLKSNQNKIMNLRKGAGIPGISIKDLGNFKIPIPNLSSQNLISENLNNLLELISSLKQEINLREKQYAYYRDKLLDFGDES